MSDDGVGVAGFSRHRYGGEFIGVLALLHLVPDGGLADHPASGLHQAGEFFVDKSGRLWYCTAGGTPGTWVKLAG